MANEVPALDAAEQPRSELQPIASLRAVSRRLPFELLLFILPLALSLGLAYFLSHREMEQRAELLAGVALDRAAQITEQISSAFRAMHVYAPSKACSPASVDFMRSVDLSSSLLQGVGYIARNALQCSSLGTVPTFVGAPDYISATGSAFRRARTLAEARRTPLLLVSDIDGYTALVHPSLLFSLDLAEDSIPEGIVSYDSRMPIISRGSVAVDWHAAPLDGASYRGIFSADGYFIAWKRSPKWDHFAYAAVPQSGLQDVFLSMALIFGPLGLLGSILSLVVGRRLDIARASLPVLLREGLKRGEVDVVYQPIVDLETGRWVGAEVLARWRRPTGELVSPDVFVPIAEQYGVIRALTRFVVDRCTADFAAHFVELPDFFLSINVSSSDLAAEEFPTEMARVCQERGLSPGAFHLEVTERAEVKLETEVENLRTLRGMGFSIGIDDFGIGYSNLAYIDRLNLDYLKIDRVFVADATRGNLGGGIIEHIIAIAGKRHLTVIAEGIEHSEQRDVLLERGVRYGQGWLFSRPLAVGEFVAVMAEMAANAEAVEPTGSSHESAH